MILQNTLNMLTNKYKLLNSDKNQLKFTTGLQLCSLTLHIAHVY